MLLKIIAFSWFCFTFFSSKKFCKSYSESECILLILFIFLAYKKVYNLYWRLIVHAIHNIVSNASNHLERLLKVSKLANSPYPLRWMLVMLPDGMIRINAFKVCRSTKPSYKLFIEIAIIFVTLFVTILYFLKKKKREHRKVLIIQQYVAHPAICTCCEF